ncbi:MAG: PKD domain-containing protein, partial [Acidobacteria bacterium]|nr:PKD domain-containing protein [Acidobacteriota bacterium]
ILFTPDAAGSGPVSFGYTVADADGNEASATVQVDVVANEPPVAVAEVFCDGLHCRFDAGASSDDLGILGFLWQVVSAAGSSELEGEAVVTDLPGAGDYEVTLTVTDVAGRSAQLVLGFSADPARPGASPIARFTYACPAAPACIFDASPSVDDVEITEYQWDFGDLTRPIGKIREYTFPTTQGSYPVTLSVRDASGQIGTYTLTVIPAPEQ